MDVALGEGPLGAHVLAGLAGGHLVPMLPSPSSTDSASSVTMSTCSSSPRGSAHLASRASGASWWQRHSVCVCVYFWLVIVLRSQNAVVLVNTPPAPDEPFLTHQGSVELPQVAGRGQGGHDQVEGHGDVHGTQGPGGDGTNHAHLVVGLEVQVGHRTPCGVTTETKKLGVGLLPESDESLA